MKINDELLMDVEIFASQLRVAPLTLIETALAAFIKDGLTPEVVYALWGGVPEKEKNRLRETWLSMKRRCESGEFYIDRNIEVCPQWAESFARFLLDMGPRKGNRKMFRRDSYDDYKPGNCFWGFPSDLAKGFKHAIVVKFKGREYSLRELADAMGMPAATYFSVYRKKSKTHELVERYRQNLTDGECAELSAAIDAAYENAGK